MAEAREYAAKHRAELQAMYDAAPEYDDGFADWAEKNNIKPVARGFAKFKEYINRKGRPKSEETLQGVYVRLPRDTVKKLRSIGRGWQSRFREKIGEMIRLGML
ncbi:MAG: BrnA antitoxin family protein [Rickettsiales bacterium]|jgi:uncharacterized protein (DUF4415 family)|nr:BrnA antitoxin family protein [Rickettsiales bacterium]